MPRAVSRQMSTSIMIPGVNGATATSQDHAVRRFPQYLGWRVDPMGSYTGIPGWAVSSDVSRPRSIQGPSVGFYRLIL
jgi:hypothetical protein